MVDSPILRWADENARLASARYARSGAYGEWRRGHCVVRSKGGAEIVGRVTDILNTLVSFTEDGTGRKMCLCRDEWIAEYK